MSEQYQRILVVKTSSLGDVVHTFPAVTYLREIFPDAIIDWWVHPQIIPLVALHPAVNNVFSYNRRDLSSWKRVLPAIQNMVRMIRHKKYDVVLDFQGLLRTALFVGFSGAPQRVGFANPREGLSRFFYNHRILAPTQGVHVVERNMQLVARWAKKPMPVQWGWPLLKAAVSNPAELGAILPAAAAGVRTIGIVPGARWESKRWPPSFYAKLMCKLHAQNANLRFVLIGAPDELVLAQAIQVESPSVPCISTVGQTTQALLLEVIRCCDALLSSDTGPLHLAVAMGVPTFSFFGPNRPDYSGPVGEFHKVYVSHLPCAPCMKRHCTLMKAGTIPCHAGLPIDVIVSDILAHLCRKVSCK